MIVKYTSYTILALMLFLSCSISENKTYYLNKIWNDCLNSYSEANISILLTNQNTNDYLWFGIKRDINIYTNEFNQFTIEILYQQQFIENNNSSYLSYPISIKDSQGGYFVATMRFDLNTVNDNWVNTVNNLRKDQYYSIFVGNMSYTNYFGTNLVIYINNKFTSIGSGVKVRKSNQ